MTYDSTSTLTTGSDGEVEFSDISGGVYEIVNADSLGAGDYKFVGSTAETNFELDYGEDKEIELLFADENIPSLFLKILDASDNEPIEGAVVGVANAGGFDQSDESGENGTAFFPQITDPVTIMENIEYTVEIRKDGYEDYSDVITISDLTEKEIKLTPN